MWLVNEPFQGVLFFPGVKDCSQAFLFSFAVGVAVLVRARWDQWVLRFSAFELFLVYIAGLALGTGSCLVNKSGITFLHII